MKRMAALAALLLALLLPGCEAEAPPADTFTLDDLPAWAGEPWVGLNGNVPSFTEEDKAAGAFEIYSDLDSLGRCGPAFANICPELMPTEERGQIGMVKPSGWHTVKYDFVDGKYLYNRCHLIGYQLAGENANEKNLITGTRYLNIRGMLPFEDEVAEYVKETGNHVLYRATPVYDGDDLLAGGVQLEGWSVEDGGAGVCFNVYCYNVQPGVVIDYADGESWAEKDTADEGNGALDSPDISSSNPREEPEDNEPNGAPTEPEGNGAASSSSAASSGTGEGEVRDYVLNTSSHRLHLPDCPGVATMSEKNRQDFHGTREEAIAQGYKPCGTCKP